MNARLCRTFASLVVTSIPLALLHADVTTRYKTEMTMNPAMSAMVAGVVKGANLAAPQETELRLKAGKGLSSSMGITSIIDFSKKEMTLLDAANMRYAKMTPDQFIDEAAHSVPEIPAATRAAMTAMKTSVSAPRLTGRTAVIQGVEAEEREIVVSIEGPASPNDPASPLIRMVMQLWTAQASEVARVPAIRELMAYSLYSYATMNPLASMDKMLKQFPGFESAFAPLLKEMQKGTTMLRMHMELFMPALAVILQRMNTSGGAAGEGPEDRAPLIQVNQELVELSTTPVSESIFQIPEGFQEASPSELVSSLFAKSKPAVRQ